jgi:hypothetical protein
MRSICGGALDPEAWQPRFPSISLPLPAAAGHKLIGVGIRVLSVFIAIINNYYPSFFGTKIAKNYQEVTIMGLLTALYKILVWVARSLALIVAVLFLSALLFFSSKR